MHFEDFLEGLAVDLAGQASVQHRAFLRVLTHLVVEVDAVAGLTIQTRQPAAMQMTGFEHACSPYRLRWQSTEERARTV